jgi:hypothetical protein
MSSYTRTALVQTCEMGESLSVAGSSSLAVSKSTISAPTEPSIFSTCYTPSNTFKLSSELEMIVDITKSLNTSAQ